MPKTVKSEPVEPLIRRVRGRRVILDADLARLYSVTTKALNQAVLRNADRFPADFAFQLSFEEYGDMRSQIATSYPQATEKQSETRMWSQLVTTSQSIAGASLGLGFSRNTARSWPRIFCEAIAPSK